MIIPQVRLVGADVLLKKWLSSCKYNYKFITIIKSSHNNSH